jgi:hypothetical protein
MVVHLLATSATYLEKQMPLPNGDTEMGIGIIIGHPRHLFTALQWSESPPASESMHFA